MPRVDNTGPEVDEWHKGQSNGSSTHDVCADCNDDLRDDPNCHNDKLKPYNGDPQGSQGWVDGGNDAPEPYECLDYTCAVCNKRLGEEDNANS